MYQDVADLNAFYRSRLGCVARRLVLARIRAMWPDATAQRLAGIGYATPYLGVFDGEAERVLAFAPAHQGVIRWPSEGRARVCLTDEAALPLPDESVDRILMVHALEHGDVRAAMMREAWRVLSAGGRLLVVVANRRGLWSKADHTPFGHGHPFSERQIDRLLRESMFTPLATQFAVHVPPSGRGLSLWSAPTWERAGRRWGLPWAGVVLVEATKQVYGAIPAGRRRTLRQRIMMPDRAAPVRAGDAGASVRGASRFRTRPARRTGSPVPRSPS